MQDQEKYSDAAAEWVCSNAGRKRFLAWEKKFIQYPVPGLPAHLAASRLTWADAEVAVGETNQ